MRRLTISAAIMISFLVAGCDEDKKKEAASSVVPQPVVQTADAKTDAPAKLSDAAPAAAEALAAVKAPANPAADPGRVTFDGDKPRQSASDLPAAVVGAADGSAEKINAKAKSLYNAPSTVNALSINEPPPPGARMRKKPVTIASASTAAGFNAKADGLRDAVADNAVRAPNGSGSCPGGMSYIDGYCIDKYEGSLTEGGTPWPYNQKLDPAKSYKAESKPGMKPQAYISGDQASAACSASGKRLCSMKEWVKACRGPMKTQYPYGAAYEPGACNEYDHTAGHSSAMRRLYGPNPSYTYGPMNDPRVDALPETVAPSASYTKCTNGYGVYDMVGNVHEWVSDKAGATGVFKGGYFEDTHINGDGCSYTTTAHGTSYHDYRTGFRCCSDPS
jgi:formylglycine-generating enzyme required for sulfatase activity/outer membrane murein-binding lipoprotein Lpp